MASSALPVVLITCASGTTGRELVKQLSATGKYKVRAGVRDLEKASKLFQGLSNVEIVKLDETDATATAAFTGLYGMYLIISEPHPSDPCFPTWFKHAKDANLQHFVFHSAITADIDDPVLLNRITFQQQEDVKATGAPYTILRPTFFHQNVEKMYYATLPEGFFIGSSNGGKYTLVDARDIASVAVKVFLEGKPHFGKSYPLTTEILTDDEMAKILSEGLGRKIEYMNLPAEAYAAELSKAGVTAPLIQAVIELEKEKNEGRTLPIQPHISQLLGRPGISFAQYVKDIAPTLQL